MAMPDGAPVPLLQHEQEFAELLRLFDRERPRVVLEIGSLYGGTLWHWLRRPWVERVVSVDLPPPDGPDHPRAAVEACRGLWAGWAGGRLAAIVGDSRDPATRAAAAAALAGVPADWLHIDGGHEYETVRGDWEAYSPLVRPGGVVAIHDVAGLPAVRRFWREVRADRRAEEIKAPGGWGYGVVYV